MKIVRPAPFIVAPIKSAREEGIDAFRALGALGVIQLHFGAWRGPQWQGTDWGNLSTAASFAARLAVPFFFVTSGYLLARRGEPGSLTSAAMAQVRRILFLFVAWSVIALGFRGALRALHRGSPAAVFDPLVSYLEEARQTPLDSLLRGPEEHLWFLPALCFGISMYVAMDTQDWLRRLRPLAACVIGVLGLAAGSYGLITLPLGLNPRNGPFIAFPLVTLGAMMAGRPRMRSTLAWSGLAAGLALVALEARWLGAHTGASWTSHDALFGFFVAGPFVLGMARQWESAWSARLAIAGRLTLGVYACHTLVAFLVNEGGRRLAGTGPSAFRELAAFILIASVSFALTWLLSRFPSTRRLVQ